MASKHTIVYGGGDTDVFRDDKLIARFVGSTHESDAASFVAGEKAVEALKLAQIMLKKYGDSWCQAVSLDGYDEIQELEIKIDAALSKGQP